MIMNLHVLVFLCFDSLIMLVYVRVGLRVNWGTEYGVITLVFEKSYRVSLLATYGSLSEPY